MAEQASTTEQQPQESAEQASQQAKPPEGYVSQEFFQQELQRRIASAKQNALNEARDALASDPDFIATIAEQHKPKGKQQPDEDFLKAWEEKHVKPLRQQIERQRERMLVADVATEVADQVHPHYLKSPVEGVEPHLVQLVRAQVEWDDEHGWVATRNGHRLPSADPSRPYAGIQDVVAEMQGNPALSYLFKDPERIKGRSNYQQGTKGAPAGSTTKSSLRERKDYHARRAEMYAAWRAEGKDPNAEWAKLPD